MMEDGSWSVQDSAELYNIEGWGTPYFFINPRGHAGVRLLALTDGSDEIDLVELTEALMRSNLKLPIILRFPDIVHHRMKLLQECFDIAMSKYNYERHFQGVFPIKCNNDRFLVEDIVKFGEGLKFGLEAGSKPELLIAIAKLRGNKEALLICNGYKDHVYIQSVLLASQLGVNAVVVLEQIEELEMVIQTIKTLGVRPLIGIRAKLSTEHGGHWGATSGEKGKFGLTFTETVRVVYMLRNEGMLDCLQLLHFHIGSQIPSISIIKEAMREASHTFCELALMGAAMQYIDVGGGLGIDYDGSKSQSSASTNYSMQNYANDVVAALVHACTLKGVSQPVIISESGRALASHHSVVVFDVLSASGHSEQTSAMNLELLYRSKLTGNPADNDETDESSGDEVSSEHDLGDYLLSNFYEVYRSLDQLNFQEVYNDAKQFKRAASSLFKRGCLSLEQRAKAEALYEVVCHRVIAFSKGHELRVIAFSKGHELPDELQTLDSSLAAIYHINLSVFRSAPHCWAIGQVFPIMPLLRLNERPIVQTTLADLTCDSDGILDRFIGDGRSLPVHKLIKGETYLMGLFLAGVYQEVMGSAHNLFGGINVVHVLCKNVDTNVQMSGQKRGYIIDQVIRGQTMEEVMKSVQHVGEEMLEELRREAEDVVANGRLSVEEAQTLLANYKQSLGSYTYLTSNSIHLNF